MSSSTCISSNSNFKTKPDNLFSKHMDSDGGGVTRFSKPMDSGGSGMRVVDTKSCRQLYLRTAYTFSRREEKENDGNMEKAKKCLCRVKDRVTLVYKRDDHENNYKVMIRNSRVTNSKGMVIFRKVKEFSFPSLMSMLRRLLACTANVDVAEH